MKIVYVAEDVHKHAGVPRCVAELVERMAFDNEVVVISRHLSDIHHNGVRFYKIPTLGTYFFRSITFLLAANLVLAYLIYVRREHFDIIHSTASDGGFFANAVTFHFCAREGLEWERYQPKRLPIRWYHFLRTLNHFSYRYLAVWIESFIMKKRPQVLVTISQRSIADFSKHYGTTAENMRVITHGVNADRFHPRNQERDRLPVRARHGIGAEEIVLLFVGGDWERKGLDTLLAALALLPSNAKLLVVGHGDTPLYQNEARALHVGERVIFAGRSEAVEEYFAAADVFVLPSLYEPYGLVISEAMASGLPVITSASAGAAQMIEDGVSGLLLESPPDHRELVAHITSLLCDASFREHMGARARAAAEAHTWDAAAKAYCALYNAVSATNGASNT